MELETSNKQRRGVSQSSSFSKGKTSVTKQATRTMKEVTAPMKEKNQWDPISITYTELLSKLIDGGLIVPVHLVPLRFPFSRWYNVNVRCNYHAGISGHSIEDCNTFKYKVQYFIKVGKLKIGESNGPVGVEDPSRVKTKMKRQKEEAPREGSSGKTTILRDKVLVAKIKKKSETGCSMTTERSKE